MPTTSEHRSLSVARDRFDVVVVGGGHAGCEAALAAARAGARTLLVTPVLDRIGFMPCNPSIGGPGKSQIVAEVDALGGAMAELADMTALQVRLLNTGKGPAVQSLRVQVDKTLYPLLMKERLETQPGLGLLQDEACGLELDAGPTPRVVGVRLRHGGSVSASSVVVTTGTFLRARIIAGEANEAGGRSGESADVAMAASLADLGIPTHRLKTGTPPRVDLRSVDLDALEPQLGDDVPRWFSDAGDRGGIVPVVLGPTPSMSRWLSTRGGRPQLPCFRTSTNERTHELVRANLHRAPMFNGAIEGVGPRSCPSVEDKVARFGDKPSHPVFLEPEGWRSNELYVQGMSTSLPPDVQVRAIRTLPGLAAAQITRFGYAVEYDAVPATALLPTLECRQVAGLFLAGQVNGTSGYEEAAGQGLLAGANAAAAALGRPPLVLRRDQAYLGVMVDDLTSREHLEPYRMLTARSEFRLSLRSSTAGPRLREVAVDHRLIGPRRAAAVAADDEAIRRALDRLGTVRLGPGDVHDDALSGMGEIGLSKPMTARDLGRRPGMTLARLHAALAPAGMDVLGAVESRLHRRLEEQLQLDGFTAREAREVRRLGTIGMRPLMIDDYAEVPGLRVEARQRLAAASVVTFSDAQRLPGVTPADIAALLIHTERVKAGE